MPSLVFVTTLPLGVTPMEFPTMMLPFVGLPLIVRPAPLLPAMKFRPPLVLPMVFACAPPKI